MTKEEKLDGFLFMAGETGVELCKMGHAAKLLGNAELYEILIEMGADLVSGSEFITGQFFEEKPVIEKPVENNVVDFLALKELSK